MSEACLPFLLNTVYDRLSPAQVIVRVIKPNSAHETSPLPPTCYSVGGCGTAQGKL